MEKTIAEINAELQAHKSESDRRHDEIFEKVSVLEKELNEKLSQIEENKVSYRTFMLVFTILSSILGYMVYQINSLHELSLQTQKDVAAVKSTISEVQGKLAPYDIEFKN